MPHPLKVRGLPRAPSCSQHCKPALHAPIAFWGFCPCQLPVSHQAGLGAGAALTLGHPYGSLGEGGSRFPCQPCLQLCKERKQLWLRPGWGTALGHDLDLVCITCKKGVLLVPLKSSHIQERPWGPERQLLTAQGFLLPPDLGELEAAANPPGALI